MFNGAVACSFGDDVTGAACHEDASMRGNSRKPNLIPLLYRGFVPIKGPYLTIGLGKAEEQLKQSVDNAGNIKREAEIVR